MIKKDKFIMELPEFLIRDDGERVKLNKNGKYEFVNGRTHPAYEYDFTHLINLGCFKVLHEDMILPDGLPLKNIDGMTVIRSKQDYEEFYYYGKNKITKYPKEYPCIAKIGEYKQHYVTYLPKATAHPYSAYCLGLNAKWHPL